jgi:NAD+ kinase
MFAPVAGKVAGVTAEPALHGIALVVHPTRAIDGALTALRSWTQARGLELAQLAIDGHVHREVAPAGTAAASDLVVALGGDGTVLAALRAAAPTGTPVLGVACGSLGALSTVAADELVEGLDRFVAGDWTPRSLPALAIAGSDGAGDWAINDFVVVRRGAGQVAADITVNGELYVRLAGDGVIVATPVGSSAYSMAAGGPVLATGTHGFVCTPIAMHGGSAPPVVVPAEATVMIDVHPGFAGFDVEIDGRRRPLDAGRFRLTLHESKVTLVTFDTRGPSLTGLRRRRLVTDSPRIYARDERAAPAAAREDGAIDSLPS